MIRDEALLSQKVIFLSRHLPLTQHPQALLQDNLRLLKQVMLRTLKIQDCIYGQVPSINMLQTSRVPKVFAASQEALVILGVRVALATQEVRVLWVSRVA